MVIALVSNPLVSVVIAVYNSENYIARSIESILNQTYKNIELIIVDDSSSDNTHDILEKYKDYESITIVFNQYNLGIAKSRNIGGKIAKGKYIAVQDADDVSLVTRIENQVEFLETRKDVVVLGTKRINIKNNVKNSGHYYDENKINNIVYLSNPIAHTSAMIRKDIYDKVNGYNETYETTVDYELYIRLIEYGKIAMLKEELVEYYIHNNSISAKKRFTQCLNSAKVKYKNIDKIGLYKFVKSTLYRCITAYLPNWIIELKRKIFTK